MLKTNSLKPGSFADLAKTLAADSNDEGKVEADSDANADAVSDADDNPNANSLRALPKLDRPVKERKCSSGGWGGFCSRSWVCGRSDDGSCWREQSVRFPESFLAVAEEIATTRQYEEEEE